MVFATRPAIFGRDPSNTSSDISGFVFQKHPLGSNILPFLVWPKFTVIDYTTKLLTVPGLPFGGLRCDRWVLGASRPAEKRRAHLNGAS